MIKINKLITTFFLIIFTSSCVGYEPIFKTSNLKFVINEYEIKGDKKIGKEVFYKLKRLSDSNKNDLDSKTISLIIETIKTKNPTIKNSAGKILEYKIDLSTKILLKDYLTNDVILNHNFNLSASYKVQDQFSETVKLENKVIQNLTNKTYEDLLVKMSENIVTK